ncbi:hypothetical protein J5837_09710 [Pseudoxanthomonas helianthi]|uniref:Uncharacterized protein n=1 Tax=Pseudoxanthomonas helianthi TaxID=1453541 RepID=A0A940X574_9GAMM|nr:hypothetical protein [Pseudoxanthomonas helianthi]MBP3984694.1 hypothetical protein [Pseudoxanthomonas helianthi]
MSEPSTARGSGRSVAFPLFMLAVGCLGVAAAWVLLALYGNGQKGWMAVIAALDAAWMLRLGGWRPGWARAALAVAGTLSVVALANWGIAALQIGLPMGLDLWESLSKPGLGYVWLLAGLANTAFDKACIAVAVAIAAWFGR